MHFCPSPDSAQKHRRPCFLGGQWLPLRSPITQEWPPSSRAGAMELQERWLWSWPGPWEAAGTLGPVGFRKQEWRPCSGPRARPSDGGGQADRQRRAVGEMSRTPPEAHQREGQAGMATLGVIEQEVSGRAMLWLDPWDGPGAWGGTHAEARPKPHSGSAPHWLVIHGSSGHPHHRGPGLTVRRIRTSSCRRAAPNAGSGSPAPGPQALQRRGPLLGSLAPHQGTRASALPPAQTPVRQLLCIYSHGIVVAYPGGGLRDAE